MSVEQPLADYRRFIAEVDQRMATLHALHGDRLTCHPGCDDCCLVDRSALPIEAEALRRALAELPSETIDRLRGALSPGRCALLLDGLCVVYDARPLICRTHGAPLLIDTGEEVGISLCDLNMSGFSDKDDFSDDDIFDSIQANETLISLNDRFVAASSLPPDRLPLRALVPK